MGIGQWNPEWVQAIVALLGLMAAVFAAVQAWKAHQTSYRPIVRVVPLFDLEDTTQGGDLLEFTLVLKNIGRGPAISIAIVQNRGLSPDDLLGEVDALEPLAKRMVR